MHEQCIKCDENKDKCTCEHPFYWTFLDPKDSKSILKKAESVGKTSNIIKKIKGWIGDTFVESILVDKKPHFFCNVNNKPKLAEKIEFENVIYRPLTVEECGYFPYEFTPLSIKLLGDNTPSKEELLIEIKKIIDNFIDICERDKHLILGDLLLSYCQDLIDTVHYPFFVGETESGKSSVLHLFRWLGYRCLYGEDIPNADIYNFLGIYDEATGTICEDEAQDLASNREKIRTYKNSYSRGALKPRIIGVDSINKKQVFYKTFCLKLFAGEKIPEDRGFQERLAIVHMTEGLPKGNIKRLTDSEKESLQNLRKKLLVWKVMNIRNGLERIDSGLEKRDQELWEDFLTICHGTKFYPQCQAVANFYIKQRHEKIWNSLEAKIFKLMTLQIQNNCSIELAAFWNNLTDEVNPQDELPGTKEKQSYYLYDFAKKITRNYLSKLFDEKFQGVKRTNYVTTGGKKHQITRYHFDLEILQKLAGKYNVKMKMDWFESSGQRGVSGKLDDHIDHVDDLKIN